MNQINTKKIYLKLTQIFVIYSALVVVGDVFSIVSFGNGLGDLFMVMLLVLAIIVVLLARLFYKWIGDYDKRGYEIFFSVNMVLFMLYILLRLSIWRGPEMRWDGSLFV